MHGQVRDNILLYYYNKTNILIYILSQGKFKWSESKIYEGEWRENCLCGYGVFKKQGKLYKGKELL